VANREPRMAAAVQVEKARNLRLPVVASQAVSLPEPAGKVDKVGKAE
jgi:hypothetical protein